MRRADRLVGEEDRFFQHRIEIAGDPECGQMGEQIWQTRPLRASHSIPAGEKAHRFEEIECLFQSGIMTKPRCGGNLRKNSKTAV